MATSLRSGGTTFGSGGLQSTPPKTTSSVKVGLSPSGPVSVGPTDTGIPRGPTTSGSGPTRGTAPPPVYTSDLLKQSFSSQTDLQKAEQDYRAEQQRQQVINQLRASSQTEQALRGRGSIQEIQQSKVDLSKQIEQARVGKTGTTRIGQVKRGDIREIEYEQRLQSEAKRLGRNLSLGEKEKIAGDIYGFEVRTAGYNKEGIARREIIGKTQQIIEPTKQQPTIEKLYFSEQPSRYKEEIKKYGFFTGTLGYLGKKSEQLIISKDKGAKITSYGLYISPSGIKGTKTTRQVSPQELGKQTSALVQTAPYFVPYVGQAILVGVGTERLTTTGGKEELNKIGSYLESRGLPSQLKYAIPAAEIGMGVIGLTAELKTYSNIRNVAKNAPTGKITTKSVSANKQTASNILISTGDDNLKALIQRNRLSGTRVYETTIPTKTGERKILWVELSSSKGTNQLTTGKRILYGVELDQKGNVVAKMGGLSIEKVNQKGVSNVITDIVRTTKSKRKLTLTPQEEQKLYTYVEEITPISSKRKGNIIGTVSESESQLIGTTDLLKIPEGKPNIMISGTGIQRPTGTKSISQEIQILQEPSLVLSKQKFGTGQIITIKGSQKGMGFGKSAEITSPTYKVSKASKPFTQTESIVSDQVLKKVIKTQPNLPSSTPQKFAETISIAPKVSTEIKLTPIIKSAQPEIKTTNIPAISLGENMFAGTKPTGIESFSDMGRFESLGETGKIKSIQLTRTETKEKQKEREKQKPIELIKQPQIEIQRQPQITSQAFKLKLLEKVKPIERDLTKPIQPTTTPSKKVIPIIPLTEKGKIKKLPQVSEEKGIEAIGFRFGKEVSLGLGTKKEASKKLKEFLVGTLGASGFLKKAGEKLEAEETGLLGAEFRKGKRSPYLVVEKREKRLRRGTTAKQIQYFKKSSSKKSKGLFNL